MDSLVAIGSTAALGYSVFAMFQIGSALSAGDMKKWDTLIALRNDVNGVLETARADKRIGKALEAHVALYAEDEASRAALEAVKELDLAELFIVSDVLLENGAPKEENVCGTGANFPGMRIEVLPAAGEKCPRCWMHSTEANAEGLCPRCARVVAGLTLD